ncbi:hypothetical protein E1160_10335 [Rhodospirillaceae bacterium RKSG073]|nr:hypothetical protein [Curvivirga aplysinae]
MTKQSAAKAWANFDITGTAVVNGSLNISSFVDSGTGLGVLNLTNSFDSASYGVSGYAGAAAGESNVATFLSRSSSQSAHTASSFPVAVWNHGGSQTDVGLIGISIYGGLA